MWCGISKRTYVCTYGFIYVYVNFKYMYHVCRTRHSSPLLVEAPPGTLHPPLGIPPPPDNPPGPIPPYQATPHPPNNHSETTSSPPESPPEAFLPLQELLSPLTATQEPTLSPFIPESHPETLPPLAGTPPLGNSSLT